MTLHIDCFMPQVSQYHVLHHFTKKFHEALKRCHSISRLLTLEVGKEASFLKRLLEIPPDCTFTFNGIGPSNEGAFLCDMLKIPHLSWLVDSPNYYFGLVKGSIEIIKNSHFNILANIDREANKIFRDIGFNNVIFLPLAVERELFGCVTEDRPYDVVMFASLINCEKIREDWNVQYPPDLVRVLHQAAETSLNSLDHSYFKAYAEIRRLTDENEKISARIVAQASPLCALDLYLRGLDRINLVRNIKCTKVHLYDKPEQKNGWSDFLGDSTNYIIHNALAFEETFEVLKKTKVALCCGSWTRDGGTERIFYAMACGALVIATRTPYLEEIFIEGKEILFYDFNKWSEVNSLVEYYLYHEEKRLKIASAGQKKVHAYHTWDHRVEELLKILPSFIKTMH